MDARRRKGKLWVAGLLVVAGTVASAVGPGAPALAATDTGSTIANVDVGSAITLTGLTPSFTLTGNPGDVASTATPVSMTITTNNFAGYTVTVEPATATLVGAIPGNTDSIPTSDLQVADSVIGTFTPLIFGTPVPVFTQASASAPDGDTVAEDYQITIPFVRPDTYTGTLNYIASTLT
jgi:hypothetical protein